MALSREKATRVAFTRTVLIKRTELVQPPFACPKGRIQIYREP